MSEKEIINETMECLFNSIKAKDKIIDEQALEISQLKNQKQQAIKKLKEIELYDEYITIHTDFIYDLKNILGDKENE